jgi:uncharacterized protein YkwD/uncharacterized protein affecting Mg2+/Co2+ transport
MALLTDVATVNPNETFTTTWRVRNTGTDAWDASEYRWVFTDGDQMGGPGQVPIADTVSPGGEYEATVTLTAPAEPGPHEGQWQIQDAGGQALGPALVVRVDVLAVAEEPAEEEPVTEEPAGEFEEGCLDASPIADVTIPDGTLVDPGETFTKIWRVRNSGSCEWSDDLGDFTWVFVSGDRLDGPDQVPIALPIPAGGEYDVEVELTAPGEPGQYQGNWRLQGPDGEPFGVVFWVQIEVSGEDSSAAEVEPAPGDMAEMALGVWRYINDERDRQGLLQLAYNDKLAQAAQIQADDCSQRSGPCSHTGSDGSTDRDRAARAGYDGVGVDESWANAASPADAVRWWLDEVPPDDWHRRMLLSTTHTEVGVGVAPAEYGYFFVAVFGRSR